MKKQYKQLTSYERDLIATHHANGFSISEIARMLSRNKSTISRELTRNTAKTSKVYLSSQAHKRAKTRKKQAATKDGNISLCFLIALGIVSSLPSAKKIVPLPWSNTMAFSCPDPITYTGF